MLSSDFSSPILPASIPGKVEVEDLSIAVIPASTDITQASGLPTRLDTRLPRIEKLSNAEDWSFWVRRVKCALELLDLTDLIDSSIPRPALDDCDYEKWRKAAKAVRYWLLSSISKDIFMRVTDFSKRDTWPDDLLKLIRSAVVPPPDDLWGRTSNISRSEFGTIPEFVKALRDLVRLTNDSYMATSPSCACNELLGGIRGEMPGFALRRYIELDETPANDLSWDSFMKLCDKTIRSVNSRGLTPSTAQSSKSSSKTAKKFR